jgi:hypothetical protein
MKDRVKNIMVRMTAEEHSAFIQKCGSVRPAIAARHALCGLRIPKPLPAIDQKLLAELSAIGNNINQITYRLHTSEAAHAHALEAYRQLIELKNKIFEINLAYKKVASL